MDIDNLILLPGGLITKNHPEVLRAVEGSFGYYSRPYIGRMAQADSIIPGGVQGLDRYAGMNNNPVRYTDPSGHAAIGDTKEGGCNTPGSPKCIIDRYVYNSIELDRELENYHRAYPIYNPSFDPLLQGSDNSVVAFAITRVECSNGNYWACGGMIIVPGFSSPSPAINQQAGSTPANYGNEFSDPDCTGCGYKSYPEIPIEDVYQGIPWGNENFPEYLPAGTDVPYTFRLNNDGMVNSFAVYNPISGRVQYRVDILASDVTEHGITGSHMQLALWNLSPTGWKLNDWGMTPNVNMFPWP